MSDLSEETVALLQYLLPGLLAAWVFYGLTSHTKPSQFERIIQALIFTFLVHIFLPVVRWPLEYVGHWYQIRPWDDAASSATSAVVALVLGALLAYLTNRDSLHKWLRARGFGTRASFPNEWHGVFSEDASNPRYIVLHMKGERRLSGYPKVWPSMPDKGHFYILTPHWLSDSGEFQPVVGIDGILISAKDVKWVEFINQPQEQNDGNSTEASGGQAGHGKANQREGTSERQSGSPQRNAKDANYPAPAEEEVTAT